MYTEDEAKDKRCPDISLILAVEAVTGNAKGRSTCIASECMHWRWVKGPSEGKPRKGYCGLSGKP